MTYRWMSKEDWVCKRKIMYGSPEAAERKARRFEYNNPKPLNSYKCPYCLGWHIGGQRGRKAKKRALKNYMRLQGMPRWEVNKVIKRLII